MRTMLRYCCCHVLVVVSVSAWVTTMRSSLYCTEEECNGADTNTRHSSLTLRLETGREKRWGTLGVVHAHP